MYKRNMRVYDRMEKIVMSQPDDDFTKTFIW
jgi:hypothetical protein